MWKLHIVKVWRCGRSTLSKCGDMVDPHFKCGGPHIYRIYPKMNVNLHYDDPLYVCINAHLKCLDPHCTTINTHCSTYIYIQNVMWRCAGSTLHPHFTCGGPHCIHFSSDMDTSFNIRYLKSNTFTCQCPLSKLST